MSKQSLKLLGHPRLKSGESLDSFLVQLRKLNFYEAPNTLSDLVFNSLDTPVKDSLRCPRQAATFEQLAALTQVDCLTLYAATAHRFAPALVSPADKIELLHLAGSQGIPLLPRGNAQKLLRPAQASQFCPTCLKQTSHHHLAWLPLAASVCLVHSCLLVSSCCGCNKPVNVTDIVEARCGKCGTNLENMQSVQVTGDFGLVAQRFIQAWLLNRSLSEAYSLPPEPPRVLLRVLEGLRFAAQTFLLPGNPYLHKLADHHTALASLSKIGSNVLAPYQSYCVYATAFNGLVDWPVGFHKFLDQWTFPGSETRLGRMPVDFGNLYTNWFQRKWQHAAFDFVQKAFDDYVAERYGLSRSILYSDRFRRDPSFAGRIIYVSINYASKLLGVTPKTVQKLVDSGQLTPQYIRNDNTLVFLKQADVLELRKERGFLVGLDEVAKVIGVSEDIALELVKAGVIPTEQAPAKEWLRWKFGKIGVHEFVEKVRDHTEIRLVSFTTVGLVAASRILMVTGLNAASIIAHVAEGKLRAYHEPSVSFACQNLFFDPRDLQALIEAIKLENNWISRERATKLLGVKDTTLAKWVKSGLLTPVAVHANAQYFDRSQVEGFPADNVTSEEAAKLLEVGELTVQRWVRQGRLEAVSGSEIDGCHAYRFEREYLLRWRHGRLTFGQALQELGVSNSTLHRWVKEGKIEPLKDMGGKQRWFSREAILMLRAKYVEKLVYIN